MEYSSDIDVRPSAGYNVVREWINLSLPVQCRCLYSHSCQSIVDASSRFEPKFNPLGRARALFNCCLHFYTPRCFFVVVFFLLFSLSNSNPLLPSPILFDFSLSFSFHSFDSILNSDKSASSNALHTRTDHHHWSFSPVSLRQHNNSLLCAFFVFSSGFLIDSQWWRVDGTWMKLMGGEWWWTWRQRWCCATKTHIAHLSKWH